MAQLVNAVELLQNNNILHRDLKPMNVMLDKNYNVKLIDFGDAKDMDEAQDELFEDEDVFDVYQPEESEEDMEEEKDVESFVTDNILSGKFKKDTNNA